MSLKKMDYTVWKTIRQEEKRQSETLILIASENLAPNSVMEAQGSALTNKYAEGYPGKRYYGGCQFVDAVESLAIERTKQVFKCEHVNVQPHSGSQANMAVYIAALKPGDTILGMSLAHGGHLTHGHPATFSGKYFNVVRYGVTKTSGLIDYREIKKLACQHNPRIIVAGSSSYSRIIDWKRFRKICDEVGAYLMADIAHYAGLIAAGIYPSPVPYADFVTMTTHKTLCGPRGGIVICKNEYAPLIDKAVFPGIQGGPLMHVIAAKAVVMGEAQKPGFKKYQEQVVKNARALAADFQARGYKIVSGGTDCHMFMLDLTPKNITGAEAERVLDIAGITVNKNAIPYDTQKPFVASGIRIGAPTVTARGMKLPEMKKIAGFIDDAISNRTDTKKLSELRNKVRELCLRFPIAG